MCKHAQFHLRATLSSLHPIGAMTQIDRQVMQEVNFVFGSAHSIWRTRFSCFWCSVKPFLFSHRFGISFFEIVSFSWRICRRRFAFVITHLCIVYMHCGDTRYNSIMRPVSILLSRYNAAIWPSSKGFCYQVGCGNMGPYHHLWLSIGL